MLDYEVWSAVAATSCTVGTDLLCLRTLVPSRGYSTRLSAPITRRPDAERTLGQPCGYTDVRNLGCTQMSQELTAVSPTACARPVSRPGQRLDLLA